MIDWGRRPRADGHHQSTGGAEPQDMEAQAYAKETKSVADKWAVEVARTKREQKENMKKARADASLCLDFGLAEVRARFWSDVGGDCRSCQHLREQCDINNRLNFLNIYLCQHRSRLDDHAERRLRMEADAEVDPESIERSGRDGLVKEQNYNRFLR
ncbi:hypothetical protein PHYPSEUDO_013580 [Phytophthora pseudosyringae]|uniref:Uncharacterized protein n=1 Tax=Phytophthora pseudosyringae TaxID=221518 RepID=A0A8T1V8K1_9STRA|nr:hypothetical protein PHYPSEUDO_013580 [Phytophthora pseudosyringae]